MCSLPLIKTSEIHCLNINTQAGIKNTTNFPNFLKKFSFLKSILTLQVYLHPIEWPDSHKYVRR